MIPTLAADKRLEECLAALETQNFRDFETVVVDNSGSARAKQITARHPGVAVLEMNHNAGFGTAINAAIGRTRAAFVATLNDDALPHPNWLAALVAAIESSPGVGMCASQVRWFAEEHLDSAGMLIAGDASSRQRGHLYPPADFPELEEVLFPSASAALYRRSMLEQVGLFDEDFFLYCEDTDLGLRARWAGWRCLYAPDAVVEHHYSYSAGRASALKAYYVERNRLFALIKNFPAGMLITAPFFTLTRYWWHLRSMTQGRGAVAQFRREGNHAWALPFLALRAHGALLPRLASLWRKRRQIRQTAKISPRSYRRLLRKHWISTRRIAQF